MSTPNQQDGQAETLVLIFPGQSSRYPGMLTKLVAEDPHAAATLARASEILGRDLGRHYQAVNEDAFTSNRDIQVGVFLANHLHLEALERVGISAQWSAGLSLGEYNHLVHIGALDFEDALVVVDKRGALYETGPSGMMASVFPITVGELDRAIAAAGATGQAVIGLENSPTQQVLSGPRDAVERVLAHLDENGDFVQTSVIEPRIPMHAPAFTPVSPPLRQVLEGALWRRTRAAYVPNVKGQILRDASAEEIVDCLSNHVHHPVLWRSTIDALAELLPKPVFLEVGPRAVLSNLFRKDWSPGRRFHTDTADSWPPHFNRLTQELRRVFV